MTSLLTFDEARDKAQKRLVELGREFERDDLVLFLSAVSEHSRGWVFPYNTSRYIETRFPLDGLVGNRPIFVDNRNGSVHIIPLGSIERWLDDYAARR